MLEPQDIRKLGIFSLIETLTFPRFFAFEVMIEGYSNREKADKHPIYTLEARRQRSEFLPANLVSPIDVFQTRERPTEDHKRNKTVYDQTSTGLHRGAGGRFEHSM